LGERGAKSVASHGSQRGGERITCARRRVGEIKLAPSSSLLLATCEGRVDSPGEKEGGDVEGEGANAGGRREMAGEGRAAARRRYLQAPSICLEHGARSPGRGSRVLGLDYDAKQCRGLVLDFRERALSIGIGPVNIRAEYLAPMSSTAKQLQLRYSGWECPNIQCQASIHTSKHGLKDIEEAKCGIHVCLLSFTSRKLNGLAHGLAHLASRSGICNHWVGVVPDFIAELAMQEVVNTVME
jgi:hypothetical protein